MSLLRLLGSVRNWNFWWHLNFLSFSVPFIFITIGREIESPGLILFGNSIFSYWTNKKICLKSIIIIVYCLDMLMVMIFESLSVLQWKYFYSDYCNRAMYPRPWTRVSSFPFLCIMLLCMFICFCLIWFVFVLCFSTIILLYCLPEKCQSSLSYLVKCILYVISLHIHVNVKYSLYNTSFAIVI